MSESGRPRLALFDVDGTLSDSQAHIVAAMEAAFAAEGLAVPGRADVLGQVGLSLPTVLARLAPEVGAITRARMAETYKSRYHALRSVEEAPLYDGIRAVLDTLAARDAVRLGCATGKSRRGLTALVAAHGLRFQTLHCADDHPSKPHPSMIHAALADTGVAARDAVMIGDTTFDMEMARAAGVLALGVGWGYHPADALRAAGAAAVVETPAALIPALDLIWSDTDV